MNMLSRLLSKLIGRGSASAPPRQTGPASDADDFAWFFPPKNLRDAAAWDEYHYQQLNHGLGGLIDMFCDDRALVTAVSALEGRTILCAGSGLSLEPVALAAAGFNVTALDLSARALQLIARVPPNSEYINPLLDPHQFRPGGSLECVAGDILDVAVCPGPFDVIVERKTAQNYPQIAEILTPLTGRLSPDGVFFTHCHDGCWRPPANPQHRVGDWLREQGWQFWSGSGAKPAGRVAWLQSSTG